MTLLRIALAGALVLAVACEKVTWRDPTQAIITVQTDQALALSSVHLAVFDATGQRAGDTYTLPLSEERALPVSFTIVPRSASTEQFRVVVTGRDSSEQAIVETKVIASFVPQRAVAIGLWLRTDCVGQLCTADSTCTLGASGEATCGSVPTVQGTPVTPGEEIAPTTAPEDAESAELDAAMDADWPDAEASVETSNDAQPSTAPEADGPLSPGEGGVGSSTEPCDGSGCEPVEGPCQGKSGGAACAGVILHACSATGETEATHTCGSPRQCELGIATKTCAPCSPGSFRCTDAQLEVCADTGLTWDKVTDCPTAALCNASAGACTDAVCAASTLLCEGDTLRGCNASQTALVTVETCMPGLCDQAGRQCDKCVANARSCSADVQVVCDATGQNVTRTPCPASTPRCVGAGACVQCSQLSDCPQPGACQVATCSSVGTCGVAPRTARSPCNGGVCNGSGSCVQCLSDTDCAGVAGKNRCNTATNECVRCTATGHCNTANHEICTNNACVVGPYCGDGKVTAPEQCDPTSAGFNAFSCTPACKRVTSYTPCGPGWPECLNGTVCNLGLCSRPCSSTADCDTVAGVPGLDVNCPVPLGTICVVRCFTNQDCPPQAICNGGQVCER